MRNPLRLLAAILASAAVFLLPGRLVKLMLGRCFLQFWRDEQGRWRVIAG